MSASKKTPNDVSEFEREQLKFMLAGGKAAQTVAELNPSLAWLSLLAEMKLINVDSTLAPWIEKNFSDSEAVVEVVANISRFEADAADVLEYRLNQTDDLPPLLVACWRLIVRHIRANRRGKLRSDWFDIEPRIKQGDRTPELLEKLADLLRPIPQVGKRSAWFDDAPSRIPETPSDLMLIDFEIDEDVTSEDVLSLWPETEPPENDRKLLSLLTSRLGAAVEDAINAKVESEAIGYGTTDVDVASVADHPQNAYKSGFLVIVRVIADVWTRLNSKAPDLALSIFTDWSESSFRLIRRLALFAAADQSVPAPSAIQLLLRIPLGELFLTNSSVEVFRLIEIRWNEFSVGERRRIERRIVVGPPASLFKEGSEVERHIDRARFELLGHIDRIDKLVSSSAMETLGDIRTRWPNWELRPAEQAGFHVWHGESGEIVGDHQKLHDISDDELLLAAKEAEDNMDFMEGSPWQALCREDAPRALRGLKLHATTGEFEPWAWHAFLWASPKQLDGPSVNLVAKLLLQWPQELFGEICDAASWWLNECAQLLEEDKVWSLWDHIEESITKSQPGEAK